MSKIMKNLVTLKIEDIELLPQKLGRIKYFVNLLGNTWSLEKYDNNNSSNKNPYNFNYNLAQRIIKKYIDKPFEDCYSHYCKKAKLQDRDVFFKFFEHVGSLQYFYKRIFCYIDDEGIIRKINNPKYNFTYKVYSWDYEREFILDLETGTHECKVISGEVFEFQHQNHLYWKKFFEQRALKRKSKRNKIKYSQYNFKKTEDIEEITN